MPKINRKVASIAYSFDEIAEILVAHARNDLYVQKELGTDPFEVEEVESEGSDYYIIIQ